ncbi:MAG: halocyanin domain-containing protein [Haloarculaceae archaeon]
MNRREFLRTAGGASGGAAVVAGAAAAPTAAAEDGGDGGGGGAPEPDYGGWLDDVSNFSSLQDNRGQDEVRVMVGAQGNGGNFAFEPPAIHVDPGTEILWEWTGEGGSHNVVDEAGDFESELTGEQGFTYSRTFDSDGMYTYYCQPHRAQGMKGVVIVGTDYPQAGGTGAATPINPEHMGVPFQAHFVGLATVLAICVALVFAFFQLKYGESAHTKGGND